MELISAALLSPRLFAHPGPFGFAPLRLKGLNEKFEEERNALEKEEMNARPARWSSNKEGWYSMHSMHSRLRERARANRAWLLIIALHSRRFEYTRSCICFEFQFFLFVVVRRSFDKVPECLHSFATVSWCLRSFSLQIELSRIHIANREKVHFSVHVRAHPLLESVVTVEAPRKGPSRSSWL